MQFIKDIKNVAYTRKFWLGVLNAVVVALLVYVAEVPEFAPLVALAAALGIYKVPNKN